MRLLLVEDDTRLSDMLARSLREQGYAVDVSHDGADAVYQASVNEYDALILDVNLPKQSGLDVSRTLRAKGRAMPILMLTARDAVTDRVIGLDAGADDYLVKPFELDELYARLRALLRRSGSHLELTSEERNVLQILRRLTLRVQQPFDSRDDFRAASQERAEQLDMRFELEIHEQELARYWRRWHAAADRGVIRSRRRSSLESARCDRAGTRPRRRHSDSAAQRS